MRKKAWILAILFWALTASAQSINAIIALVNKEPITAFELEEAMRELRLDKTKALKALINDRLEEAEAKRIGIFVNDFELENELKAMLESNKSDMQALQAKLRAQNQSLEEFKAEFKKQILRKKLYESVGGWAKIDYSDNGLRDYYETHSQDFVVYESIAVLMYVADDEKSLELLQKTGKKPKGVRVQSASLSLENSDPRLLAFLSRLEPNAFSPILQNELGLISYQVKAKQNPQSLPFDQIKNEVSSVYINEQRQLYIEDFFEKLRAKAQISYLR